MAGVGGILGNVQLQQLFLWNVASMLLSAALGPYMTALSNQVNQLTPLTPLSPAEMADAVIRNIVSQDAAAAEARFAGVNAERFDQLVKLAGNAPDPTSLAVALRRKLIDAATYDRGIRQGRLRDEWADLVRQLAVQQPSPESMLAAYLEGQIGEAEARDRYHALGGDPDYFTILYNSQGQAPTPVQALELANRGVIGWSGRGPESTSYEQAFLEGPWRNKWLPAFRALGEYLPPPRTVTAMHRAGSISTPVAARLLEQQGLRPDLAAAYLSDSSKVKLAPTKQLAETTVLALYRDRLISRAATVPFLEALGWSSAEAEYILEVEDLRLTEKAITAAVTRLHSLYTGHKLSRADALSGMARLGVEAIQADQVVSVWDYERAANVKHLTPVQILSAETIGLLDGATARQMLEDQGYTPHDAWLYLSIHRKAAQPNEPPGGAVAPVGGP